MVTPDPQNELECKIHLDLHCPEWHPAILSRIDPGAISRRARAAGAQQLYVFAKDHYGNAYYATRIGHRHTGLRGRDLLREFVEAGKEADLPIVAYYSVIWDNWCANNRPEWCMRDAQDRPIAERSTDPPLDRWRYLCHNSGYLNYARTMLAEVAEAYPVAGFHLDMFNLPFSGDGCYCTACRALFRERHGRDLTPEEANDRGGRDLQSFRYDSVEQAMRLLVDAVRAIRPALPVSTNYHGSFGFDRRVGQMPVRHSRISSVQTGETYTPVFGDLYPGLEGRFLHSLDPNKPCELVCWRMNRITDFTVKPIHQLRWEGLTAMAHRCSLMVIDQPYHDGTLDEVTYERLGTVFKEIESKRALFGGTPARHVGLYYSCKTRDQEASSLGFQRAVLGAYKALVESHYPLEFIFDENVSAARLAEFPVVWLPNVSTMSETECGLIADYVREGGFLVATGATSMKDERGRDRSDFGLADVLGVRYEGILDCDWHYLRSLPRPYGNDLDPRQFILNTGPAVAAHPAGAEHFGGLHEAFCKPQAPDRFYSHSVHPPHDCRGAAIYLKRFGRGAAIYLPNSVDASYAGFHESPEHRLLMRNMVELAGYQPPVRLVKGPLNVEFVLNRMTGGRWLVHLLAFNGTRQAVTLASLDRPMRPSVRMDEAPLYRAELQVNVPFSTVRAWNPDTRVEVKDNRVCILCEDVHEAITIEPA